MMEINTADFHIPPPLRRRDVRNMNHDRYFDRIDGWWQAKCLPLILINA
jgi:hypothetical protein